MEIKNEFNVFDQTYLKGYWGRKYNSGSGSHDKNYVESYVNCVKTLLRYLDLKKATALDIGCGDFNVGSQICGNFFKYDAYDISKVIIERNKNIFNYSNVNFEVKDISKDDIGYYDVIFARQVFQHITNKNIQIALEKITRSCKCLIFTDGLPPFNFIPNIDMSKDGPWTRLLVNSGVVLDQPPFNLNSIQKITVLNYISDAGRMLTTAYLFTDNLNFKWKLTEEITFK